MKKNLVKKLAATVFVGVMLLPSSFSSAKEVVVCNYPNSCMQLWDRTYFPRGNKGYVQIKCNTNKYKMVNP